jgi:hypothetical protein
MKVLLGDLNSKVLRVDIFKLTVSNCIFLEAGNNNGMRAVNFTTSATS